MIIGRGLGATWIELITFTSYRFRLITVTENNYIVPVFIIIGEKSKF